MKKLTTTIALSCVISIGVFGQNENSNDNAQNQQRWRTNGNQANENHFIGTTNEAPLNLRTNNKNRLHITPDGRIGVGLTNPIAKLQVEGDLRLSGDVTFDKYADQEMKEEEFGIIGHDRNGTTMTRSTNDIRTAMYTPGDDYWDWDIDDGGGGGHSDPWTEDPVIGCPDFGDYNPVWYNDHEVLYTGASGYHCYGRVRVGIGTRSPSSELTVVGSISIESSNQNTVFKVDRDGKVFAREVKVTLLEIPDYVFASDYNLPSLAVQKDFIQTNGHLLGVPSEKEMLEQETGLGELTMTNLRINEEQMLYLIEMEEQVNELQEENKDLKAENQALEKRVVAIEKLLKELNK